MKLKVTAKKNTHTKEKTDIKKDPNWKWIDAAIDKNAPNQLAYK